MSNFPFNDTVLLIVPSTNLHILQEAAVITLKKGELR